LKGGALVYSFGLERVSNVGIAGEKVSLRFCFFAGQKQTQTCSHA